MSDQERGDVFAILSAFMHGDAHAADRILRQQ
jgi:hypothetical protein